MTQTTSDKSIQSVDNIIFLSDKISDRAGGPAGYLANLRTGLAQIDHPTVKIVFISDTEKSSENKIKKYSLRLLTFWIPVKNWRRGLRSKLEAVLFNQDDKYARYEKELNRYQFQSVTCHTVDDTLFLRRYLDKKKSKATLISMSHSPQPPAQEAYDSLLMKKDPRAEKIYQELSEKEKKAFYAEDIFLFPSKESIEPYSSALPYFQDILERKPIHFLPTGCSPLSTPLGIEELRQKYQITTPYVISYMGRHIPIKGYDLLQNIAQKILSIRQDVTFLIGGRMSGIPPLNHKNWVELGFVNPAEIFRLSDCFILPNRQTYFDLVLLEALSMGTVVFASETGGNKTVYQQTKAISLYSDEDSCVRQINQFLDMPASEKQRLKDDAKQAYLDNYTLDIFARRYIKFIEDITKHD